MHRALIALAATLAVLARADPGRSAAALSGGAPTRGPGAEEVRAAVEAHVGAREAESSGVYRLPDERTGKALDLEFLHVGVVSAGALWHVHDPDRKVGAKAFLACARFHPRGEPAGSVYDVDFLVEPAGGVLAVTDVRLHKATRLVNGRWVWEPIPRPARAAEGSRR